MRHCVVFIVLGLLSVSHYLACGQSIEPVSSTNPQVILKTATAPAGGTITLLTAKTADACATSTVAVPPKKGTSSVVRPVGETTLSTASHLKAGSYLCAVIKSSAANANPIRVSAVKVSQGSSKAPNSAASAAGDPDAASESQEKGNPYTDESFDYVFLGGIEQADLSAQSSVTEGFYDLSMRERFNDGVTGIWFRSRYLGTPSSSSKQNIVAAATNPSGTLTASNLPQSVAAVDYSAGVPLYDFKLGSTPGKLTLTPLIGVGATTPLSATTIRFIRLLERFASSGRDTSIASSGLGMACRWRRDRCR